MSAELGEQISPWTLVPFFCMLLSVAVLPLVAGPWFHHNRNKGLVALVLGLPTVIYLVAHFGQVGLESVGQTAREYASFIIILSALYVISGGIYLTGNLIATPRTNIGFLVTGAVLASFIGTMGASMVLIRPLLRANCERRHARHTIIFFLFAVSNIGGMLTPLGDPPLFLGFLRGVPFGWTLGLWPQWLLSVGLVLAVYLVLEYYYYRKEPAGGPAHGRGRLRAHAVEGEHQHPPVCPRHRDRDLLRESRRAWARTISFPFVREVILVILAIVSLRLGPRGPRAANHFKWAPIVEVAVLFAGIFATMIPALALLEAKGASIGVAVALALLLGHWGPLGLPRQCAHLSGLHLAGAGAGGGSDGGGSHVYADRSRARGRAG